MGDTAGGAPLSTEGLAGIRTREEFLDRLRKAKAAAGISLTAVPGLSKSKVERLLKGTIDAERLAFFLTALAIPGPEQWQWAEAWSRSTGTVVAPPAPGARRLQDWTPKLLGIHDAIDGLWPTYVPRQHDTDLRRHLRLAAASGGLIVLFGESCSGKTRSLYEAVLRELPGWWLARPRISELTGLASSQHTIVWLDEIDDLLEGQSGLELTSIVRLLDPLNPVVIVATMPQTRFTEFTVERDGRAASILELATTMEIADQLTATERKDAEAIGRQDPAVAEALSLSAFGLTQALAGAPELISHWARANKFARSVILAAVDARRVGVSGPLSAAYLEAAAPGYWEAPVRNRATADWFSAAFDFSRAILRGATAALPEVAGEEIGSRLGWTVADYLLQTLVRQLRTTPVCPSTWGAIADEVRDPEDLLRAGIEAQNRLLYVEAEMLYRREGTARGILRLMSMQLSRGHRELVLPMLTTALDAGLPVAMQLANVLVTEDRLDDAVPFFELAAEHRERLARQRLATLLSQAGRLEEALQQWRRVYVLEAQGPGRDRVAQTLAALGRVDEAEAFLAATTPAEDPRPVVERSPDPDGMARSQAESLVAEGKVGQAVKCLQRCIDGIDPVEGEGYLRRRDVLRWSLLRILRDHGGLADQVEVMRAMVRERPNSDALAMLAGGLCELGAVDELRGMVAKGMPYAPLALARCLRKRDYDALRQRARDGDRAALGVLTEDLVQQDRISEAIELWHGWCQTTVDREQLAALLTASGRKDDAVVMLREAAESESGDVFDMRAFVDLLASLEFVDELIPLAERGIPAAERALATIMAATDPQSHVLRTLVLTARGMATHQLNAPASSDPTGPAARLLRDGLTASGELAPWL